jgi:hypothetical protein
MSEQLWVYTKSNGFVNLSQFTTVTPWGNGCATLASKSFAIELSGADARAVLNCMTYSITDGDLESFDDLVKIFDKEQEDDE